MTGFFHPLLQPLWRPTLLRRVLGALLLAFMLAGAALLGLHFVEFKREMAERPGVQALADGMAVSLAALASPRDAGLVVQVRARELARLRRDAGQLPGDIELALHDMTGRTVFATPGADRVHAETHWLARASAGAWQLTVAEPRIADATVLGWLGLDLLGSLLFAFPFVLLPLWIAVRRGMRPLNQLAEAVGRRDAQDLSPLGFRPQHEELKPLSRAFDDLLARLRAQLQRERAFVQDAAHELRTPMAVIAAQAHLLRHASDPSGRQMAGVGLDAALQRASHLSRQLLTLARLDEAHEDAREPVDIAALVQHALAQAAPPALERGMELSLDAQDTLRARLDPAAFESVLHNLIDNALRYVPPGGRIAVTLKAGPPVVLLRVADDGPGIPQAQRAAAFERFWRGAAAADAPGTGLGLAIVRQAVSRLGGQVHISDELDGRGVAFEVTLPA